MLYVSTDYVFDGAKGEPYVEVRPHRADPGVRALQAGGRAATAGANPNHLIVRSSWLFGAGGKNFVETMLGLAEERDELGVVDDQVGSPTFTGHLAEALLTLSEAASADAARGPRARALVRVRPGDRRASGRRLRVEPCTTDEFPRPARAAGPTPCSRASAAARAARLAGRPRRLPGVRREAARDRRRRLHRLDLRAAVRDEHELVVLDKLTYAGRRENVPTDVELVVGGIEDRELVRQVAGGGRGRELRGRVARGPLDRRPGRVRAHARDRHRRAARRGARAGRAALPPGLHRRGLRLDRRGLVHRELAARPLLALLGHQGGGRPARVGAPPHLRHPRR